MEGVRVIDPRSVLHVGCGTEPLPDWLAAANETRLDIDPAHKPDIVASMTDLGPIGPFDAVYSNHCLEHLYPHEVPVALSEFHRVLHPGGHVLIFVPDLEDVRPTEDVLFTAPVGPITGLDLYYGLRRMIEEKPHMAHHCGFVSQTLNRNLVEAGFVLVTVQRLGSFNLFAAAVRP